MYSLNANKVGVADRQPAHVLGHQHAPSTTASSSAPTCAATSCCCSAASPPIAPHECDDHRATTRDNPNSLRFCDSTPPFRTTYKLSAAYQLPWEFQLSGSFIATPGPSVNANYTVTAAIAGRPIIGSHRRRARRSRVNLIEPNTVFLDYKKQLDLRIARNFRFGTPPHPGLRGHLQRAERRHRAARQRDLRLNPATNRG